MAHVVSVTLARNVSPLPNAFNAEPCSDEQAMHVPYAAKLRVGDFYGPQTPCREEKRKAEDSS